MYECMNACMYAFIHVSMYVSMYVCIYLCMYVCKYFCVCIYVCSGAILFYLWGGYNYGEAPKTPRLSWGFGGLCPMGSRGNAPLEGLGDKNPPEAEAF